MRGFSSDECNGASALTSKGTPRRKSERMSNGDAKELHVGDSIVLVAPNHKSAAACEYRLTHAEDGKLFLEKLESKDVGDGGPASKRPKGDAAEEVPVPTKKRKLDCRLAMKEPTTPEVLEKCTNGPLSPTASQETVFSADELGRCPTCRKLFHALYLPIHCPACQEPYDPTKHRKPVASMEECVFCENIFPVGELAAHHEVCKGGAVERELETCGMCPSCSAVLPIVELIEHSAVCREAGVPQAKLVTTSAAACEEMEVDGAKMLVCADGDGSNPAGRSDTISLSDRKSDPSPVELEQCAFCLEDFPLCEMPAHYPVCPSKKSKVRA